MFNMVSWKDYEGVEGFYGASSPQDVQDLNKALVAGSDRDPPGSVVAGDGFSLRVESLERTLKNTTFRAEHVRLWRALPKIPAYNTVEEYNQVQAYGGLNTGAFISEGALPSETDATYERKFAFVKFMGTIRRVSHQMTLVRPAHGNVIAQETVAGTMYLLQQIEQNLFYGDSTLDPVQWDGFEKLIADNAGATNIIDLRGRPLSEDILMDAALTIMDAPNYGLPTHLHINPKVKSDLVKTFFPKARYELGMTGNGMIGSDIKGFTSPAGDVRFEPNVFITDGGGVSGLVAQGDASSRPGSPTVAVAPAAGAAGGSLFGVSDIGAYFYWVVAVNRFGSSAAVQMNVGALSVTSGDGVTFTVSPGAGALPAYYIVYRTAPGGAASSARMIQRATNIVGGVPSGANLVITDLNARLPGTSSGFLFQQNLDNMSFKQLAPMIKIPLATVDPSIRWMQLLYGVPVLYTPKHNVLFRNIGRAADYVGAP